MAKKEKLTLSKDARQMKRRIRKTRGKAQRVGFLYLIGTILLAALAVLPTLNIPGIAVMGDNTALWAELNLGANVDTICRVLYVLMLLIVIINVFKAFSKLGWLYKKKASKTYGLNRNVYAMQSLGKIFSSSFAVIIINSFLIVLLSGSYAGALTDFEAFKAILADNMFVAGIPNMLIIIAVGVVFHLICGWFGAKVSLFTVEEGLGVVEQKRQVGRFASLFRNILQIAVALVIPYLVLKLNVVNDFVGSIIGDATAPDSILAILQLVIVLCWLVLIKHATATTEFNAEGADGAGMKNFTVFMFFTLVASAAMYFLGGFEGDASTCAIALLGISFVMFVIQILLRKAPGLPEEEGDVPEDVELDEEGNPIPVVEDTDDVDLDYFFMDSYVF